MNRFLNRAGIALMILVFISTFAVAEGGRETTAAEEPLEIIFWASRGVPVEDAPIVPMVEELISEKVGYPVDFIFDGVALGENGFDALSMKLAANELPDSFLIGFNEDFLEQSATKFELEELQQYMPEMYKFLTGLMDQLDLDPDATWARYQDDDGMMWGVPRIWDMGWVPSGQVWRKDVLDELGYDVPTTLDEAEEIFDAYKSLYPDEYALTGRGAVDWQAFDLVFNAFGLVGGGQHVRDGRIVQFYATREFREALQVLRRWYQRGYWDPNFVNHSMEWVENFAAGNYLVTQWVGNSEWMFNSGAPTRYLDKLRDVPGVSVVAATHLAADENTKPMQRVWNPFLAQLSVFGNHLQDDPDRLHRLMEVFDVLSQDREVKILSSYGVEGEHWEYPEGETVPQFLPEMSRLDQYSEREPQYGFGFMWQGNLSTYTMLTSTTQKAIDDFVLSPDGPYHSSKLDYWFPVVMGSVTDMDGEEVQVSTPTSWFELVVDIMTGAEPIEYYDEWLESYYDSGGRNWEEQATRLYLE